jgi:hypothetical protein
MRKTFLLVVILVTILAALGLATLAFAQTQTPSNPDQPYEGKQAWGSGWGMMGSGHGMMGGRWNRNETGQPALGSYGPMHEYMISALAQFFNLTPEDIESRHAAGETMWDIAAAQGFTQEQFFDAMLEARTSALSEAVAAGAITQEQADWMLTRMSRMGGTGVGPGGVGCPGMGAGFQGRPGGGRWNQ